MPKRKAINEFRRATARRLRANTTDAESRLWFRLRRSPILGSHFRRQVPIGLYVADFACMASRLIIEIDGSQHGLPPNIERDAARTRWLEAEGYRVLRFWNNDVYTNIEGILESIRVEMFGDIEPKPLKHSRRLRGAITPPRRATRADPPPPGEGEQEKRTS